ncbi:hypothetical protein [Halegenticoccus tardaugens]|uniref:hypothetical protein n=1 Tax=Halegenticoccus tardaugens TaxID=2071624 RepID=UPI00100BD211|nr:hypothetical protein [Halegenticoccus tardaugens]
MSDLSLFGPGTWLIFGIVLAPVYGMLIAWAIGEPSDLRTGLLGVGYLVALTCVLWGGLLALTLVIGVMFF